MDYMHWDVDRVIFHIAGPLGLRWYSLCFLLAFLVGNAWFHSMFRAEGRSTKTLDSLLFYVVIGTIVGARLGHVLFYGFDYYSRHPLDIFKVWEGGLASHGGFAAVLVGVWYYAYKYKTGFLWLSDRIAICAVMAGGFIRIGNFFNSEIVGKVAEVPWAIIFDKVDSLPRHPTQLYEAIGYFSISLILYGIYRYYRRSPLPGRILGWAMVIAFSFRFAIEEFKIDQEAFEADMLFNMGQWLSVPFVLVGIMLIYGVQKQLGFATQPRVEEPSSESAS